MGRAGASLSVPQGMTPAVPPPLQQGQPEEDNGRRINHHSVARLIFGWEKGKSCCGPSVSVTSMSGAA